MSLVPFSAEHLDRFPAWIDTKEFCRCHRAPTSRSGSLRLDSNRQGITIPGLRGRGIGTTALVRLVEYLFSRLDTHRVQARVLEDDPWALARVRRARFREESQMRGVFRVGGRHIDAFIFDLLRQE